MPPAAAPPKTAESAKAAKKAKMERMNAGEVDGDGAISNARIEGEARVVFVFELVFSEPPTEWYAEQAQLPGAFRDEARVEEGKACN